MLEYTDIENQLIFRLSAPGGWDHADAKNLKRKIKDYFLCEERIFCCYCRQPLSDAHRMTIDIEHVLPKGEFPRLTFTQKNLNISCKRCNMGIKRTDRSFYLSPDNEAERFQSAQYSFIHPNLDNYESHLIRRAEQLGTLEIVKYSIVAGSPKGTKTYQYFRLQECEINSVDVAQGLSVVEADARLPAEIAKSINEILKSIA